MENKIIRESKVKRLFDMTLSLAGIILSFPLWLLIAFAVNLEDGGPIFYAQNRVGKGGELFRLIKFRSMIKDAEKYSGPVWAKENDMRLTKLGRFLRATALDELPQLLSILRGDMSFVGPRPERPELDSQFNNTIPEFNLRHLVTPGLTGLAQVCGRYDTPPHDKIKYDLLYINKQSFFLDLWIICISFWITFKGKWEIRKDKFGFLKEILNRKK